MNTVIFCLLAFSLNQTFFAQFFCWKLWSFCHSLLLSKCSIPAQQLAGQNQMHCSPRGKGRISLCNGFTNVKLSIFLLSNYISRSVNLTQVLDFIVWVRNKSWRNCSSPQRSIALDCTLAACALQMFFRTLDSILQFLLFCVLFCVSYEGVTGPKTLPKTFIATLL